MKAFSFTQRKWFKNIKFVVLSSIMIAMSLFCALHDFTNSIRGSNIIAHPIGWIGVIFFGFALIYMLYKNILYALKGRGMVVIAEDGLIHRDDFIPWKTIVRISGNKYYITILTNDTKERMQKASWLTKLNHRMDGATVRISNWDYDGSQEEFIERCMPYLKDSNDNKSK